MRITCQGSARKPEAAPRTSQSPADEMNYVARLREVETALLCQALGGQLPQPDTRQRLQHYLEGKINRAEAFRALSLPAEYPQQA